jgi:hypothetical protein
MYVSAFLLYYLSLTSSCFGFQFVFQMESLLTLPKLACNHNPPVFVSEKLGLQVHTTILRVYAFLMWMLQIQFELFLYDKWFLMKFLLFLLKNFETSTVLIPTDVLKCKTVDKKVR